MDIASTTNTRMIPSADDRGTPGAPGGGIISSDFETFLKMLTTQMQNQDPLNPMESTDFAVQLATFSGVEQQVQTNQLLDAMSAQLGALNMSDLAGWVGMEARAVASAWFDKSPVTLYPAPPSGTSQAFVVVRDSAGNAVDRVEIPVSDEPVQWAGVTSGGITLPPGHYSFHLQSFSNDKVIGDTQIAVFSEVVEARVENGQTILVLGDGSEIAAAEIGALRRPAVP